MKLQKPPLTKVKFIEPMYARLVIPKLDWIEASFKLNSEWEMEGH